MLNVPTQNPQNKGSGNLMAGWVNQKEAFIGGTQPMMDDGCSDKRPTCMCTTSPNFRSRMDGPNYIYIWEVME